jgi:hypothetical protein
MSKKDDADKVFESMLAKMRADNDQDIENGKAWIRESDPIEVINLWEMMNREYPNVYTEIMTRFAIIGFTVVADSLSTQESTQ